MRRLSSVITLGLILGLSSVARAQFSESEPNETKATATPVVGIVSGGTINGTTTGSSTTTAGPASADTYRIKTGALPLGIYQHDLVITTAGVAGHSGSIRGLNQTAGVAGTTDTTAQTSSTTTVPARMNRWYGFGKEEEIYWRAAGTASTTTPYLATLTTTPVTPTVIGPFTAGTFTISTVGQTPASASDTDLWIYDANLDAIPGYGNDDEFLGSTFQSRLVRPFAPGTYYMALSTFQLANNQTAPVDDDFRTGTLLDFPNAVINTSSLPTTATPAAISLNFSVTDGCGATSSYLATKPGSYGVLWVQFTVLPAIAPWETNDAAASLALDGLEAGANSGPASVVKCTNQYTRMTIGSTNVGMPWDLFLSAVPLVPAGPTCGAPGIRTAGGQAINLDIVNNPGAIVGLAGPFWFLNTFTGNQLIVINSATPFSTVCGQMVIADATSADGFSLSGGACLRYEAPTTLAAPVAGPVGDDSAVSVNVGCVPFFFRAFTQMHVISNGRITFGSADVSFAPSAASATAGPGWFGTWVDCFPTGAGPANLITIDSPAPNIFRAHYEQVNLFTAPGAITTDLVLDANDGSLTISGLASLPAASTEPMMIGVCKGTGGTDPGATVYALGGPNAPAGPNAAIYAFDTIANLSTSLAGINTLRFNVVTAGPNCGGYEWIALP